MSIASTPTMEHRKSRQQDPLLDNLFPRTPRTAAPPFRLQQQHHKQTAPGPPPPAAAAANADTVDLTSPTHRPQTRDQPNVRVSSPQPHPSLTLSGLSRHPHSHGQGQGRLAATGMGMDGGPTTVSTHTATPITGEADSVRPLVRRKTALSKQAAPPSPAGSAPPAMQDDCRLLTPVSSTSFRSLPTRAFMPDGGACGSPSAVSPVMVAARKTKTPVGGKQANGRGSGNGSFWVQLTPPKPPNKTTNHSSKKTPTNTNRTSAPQPAAAAPPPPSLEMPVVEIDVCVKKEEGEGDNGVQEPSSSGSSTVASKGVTSGPSGFPTVVGRHVREANKHSHPPPKAASSNIRASEPPPSLSPTPPPPAPPDSNRRDSDKTANNNCTATPPADKNTPKQGGSDVQMASSPTATATATGTGAAERSPTPSPAAGVSLPAAAAPDNKGTPPAATGGGGDSLAAPLFPADVEDHEGGMTTTSKFIRAERINADAPPLPVPMVHVRIDPPFLPLPTVANRNGPDNTCSIKISAGVPVHDQDVHQPQTHQQHQQDQHQQQDQDQQQQQQEEAGPVDSVDTLLAQSVNRGAAVWFQSMCADENMTHAAQTRKTRPSPPPPPPNRKNRRVSHQQQQRPQLSVVTGRDELQQMGGMFGASHHDPPHVPNTAPPLMASPFDDEHDHDGGAFGHHHHGTGGMGAEVSVGGIGGFGGVGSGSGIDTPKTDPMGLPTPTPRPHMDFYHPSLSPSGGDENTPGILSTRKRPRDDMTTTAAHKQEPDTDTRPWTPEEDRILEDALRTTVPFSWMEVTKRLPSRTALSCQRRWKVIRPARTIGRLGWTPEHDAQLRSLVASNGGVRNVVWESLSKHIEGFTARQCRERWETVVGPRMRNDTWTAEEDQQLVSIIRSCPTPISWPLIAHSFPARTPQSLKDRYYGHLRMHTDEWLFQKPQCPDFFAGSTTCGEGDGESDGGGGGLSPIRCGIFPEELKVGMARSRINSRALSVTMPPGQHQLTRPHHPDPNLMAGGPAGPPNGFLALVQGINGRGGGGGCSRDNTNNSEIQTPTPPMAQLNLSSAGGDGHTAGGEASSAEEATNAASASAAPTTGRKRGGGGRGRAKGRAGGPGRGRKKKSAAPPPTPADDDTPDGPQQPNMLDPYQQQQQQQQPLQTSDDMTSGQLPPPTPSPLAHESNGDGDPSAMLHGWADGQGGGGGDEGYGGGGMPSYGRMGSNDTSFRMEVDSFIRGPRSSEMDGAGEGNGDADNHATHPHQPSSSHSYRSLSLDPSQAATNKRMRHDLHQPADDPQLDWNINTPTPLPDLNPLYGCGLEGGMDAYGDNAYGMGGMGMGMGMGMQMNHGQHHNTHPGGEFGMNDMGGGFSASLRPPGVPPRSSPDDIFADLTPIHHG